MDVAILLPTSDMQGCPYIDLQRVPLSTELCDMVGCDVSIIGFPFFAPSFNLDASVVAGSLSRVVMSNANPSVPVVLHSSASTYSGCSGGLVMRSSDGCPIGLVTHRTLLYGEHIPEIGLALPLTLLLEPLLRYLEGGKDEEVAALQVDLTRCVCFCFSLLTLPFLDAFSSHPIAFFCVCVCVFVCLCVFTQYSGLYRKGIACCQRSKIFFLIAQLSPGPVCTCVRVYVSVFSPSFTRARTLTLSPSHPRALMSSQIAFNVHSRDLEAAWTLAVSPLPVVATKGVASTRSHQQQSPGRERGDASAGSRRPHAKL